MILSGRMKWTYIHNYANESSWPTSMSYRHKFVFLTPLRCLDHITLANCEETFLQDMFFIMHISQCSLTAIRCEGLGGKKKKSLVSMWCRKVYPTSRLDYGQSPLVQIGSQAFGPWFLPLCTTSTDLKQKKKLIKMWSKCRLSALLHLPAGNFSHFK